jgi:hypothetical protein
VKRATRPDRGEAKRAPRFDGRARRCYTALMKIRTNVKAGSIVPDKSEANAEAIKKLK